MFTGEFDIDVQGKKRTLRFGMLSFSLFCESEGIDIPLMAERLQNPKPFTQINLIYAAAIAHCRINKIESDFTLDDVSTWIDEVGNVKLAELILKSMQTYLEKNQKAPVKTGQKKLSGDGQKH